MQTSQLSEYFFKINGMSCEHCVKKVEDVVLNLNEITSVKIDLETGKAAIIGGQSDEIIQAISDAGYPTEQLLENSNQSKSSSENDKNDAIKEKNTQIDESDSIYSVSIEDMTCSSCVSHVEEAILSVDGVTSGTVNLIEKKAQVIGGVPHQVVQAIIDKGYSAQLIKAPSKKKTIQIIINKHNNNDLLAILTNNNNIDNIEFFSSKNDSQFIADIKTSLHPAKILAILQKNNIEASIHEEFEDPNEQQARQTQAEIKKSWQRAILAGSIGAGLMLSEYLGLLPEVSKTAQILGFSSQLFWFAIALLCLFTMWFSGRHYYRNAIKQAKYFSANMDTLVALGTSAAWLSSVIIIINPEFIPGGGYLYLDAGVIILAFLQIGHALEISAKQTTSESIASIVKLSPKTACVVIDEVEVTLPVSVLQVGDIIKVRPGETIPIDGLITTGASSIDESMLTGEPIPIKKSQGDQVIGGTINKSGSFTFKVSKSTDDTTLAHIIKMVQQAQTSKPKIGRIVDKIASIFVPIVIVISLLTLLLWFFLAPEPALAYALTTAIAVLVIACPCALGLATPIAIMMGTSKAAQLNVLIKNSDALQTASQLSHIVVDKTGTLTQGSPKVTDIIINEHPNEGITVSEKSLLELASSLESHSQHPLAEAILLAAKEQNILSLSCTNFKAIDGRGVQAEIVGQETLLGNQSFMQENDIAISDRLISQSERLSQTSATPVWIARNGFLWGLIMIKDPIREDSFEAVKQLKNKGITVVVCSGDNQNTVKSVASELGITDFHYEVTPKDKLNVIKQLQNEGHKVGMVGDGVNDAAALAQADTGFAIGNGTDVAIENADITLAGNSLINVNTAIAISSATITNIKQNLFGAFIYNVIGIPLAAGLFYPLTGWLLAPAFASAAMALSSVTVVMNANRLRFFKPE